MLSFKRLVNFLDDKLHFKRWSEFVPAAKKGGSKDGPYYSVGIHFNDYRLCFILLKLKKKQLSVEALATTYLTPGMVTKGNIMDMQGLSSELNILAENFKAYTRDIVMELPPSLVTMEYFAYDPEKDGSLMEAAEFRAAKVANLDEINFDYFSFAAPGKAARHPVLLVVAKNFDIQSRESLAEVSDLRLSCLDVANLARANALFYWLNRTEPRLEKELIALCDIEAATTQVIFTEGGKLLKTNEINQGLRDLFMSFPEAAEIEENKLFELTQNPNFSLAGRENLIADLQEKLIQEIYRSIQIFYSQSSIENTNVAYIFITGIGAAAYSIQEDLEDRLGIPARIIEPLSALVKETEDKPAARLAGYTSAFGLALRGFL